MALKTTKFDVAEFLGSEDAIAEYLTDALELGDPAYFNHAVGTVARARGMTQIAKETGIKREALYRALSETGNPQYTTMHAVLKALGVKLVAHPAAAE